MPTLPKNARKKQPVNRELMRGVSRAGGTSQSKGNPAHRKTVPVSSYPSGAWDKVEIAKNQSGLPAEETGKIPKASVSRGDSRA